MHTCNAYLYTLDDALSNDGKDMDDGCMCDELWPFEVHHICWPAHFCNWSASVGFSSQLGWIGMLVPMEYILLNLLYTSRACRGQGPACGTS